MSEEILELYSNGATIYVTAFCGKNFDKSVQITVRSFPDPVVPGISYITLSSRNVKKLIKALQERIGD